MASLHCRQNFLYLASLLFWLSTCVPSYLQSRLIPKYHTKNFAVMEHLSHLYWVSIKWPDSSCSAIVSTIEFQPNHLFVISYYYVYVIMYYTFFRIIKQPSVSLHINFNTPRYYRDISLKYTDTHSSFNPWTSILSKMFSLQIAFNLLHQSKWLLSSPKRWICNHSGKNFTGTNVH